MKPSQGFELPDDLKPVMRKAIILEWVTIGYLSSVTILMATVMGSSQAMRTAWIEDTLSLIPPIGFLVAQHFREKAPNHKFPYGYHRAVTIAFLMAALALLTMGALLLYESVSKLISAERPAIGGIDWFGEPIWQGWIMLPVLAYSVIPSVFLGRMKQEPAKKLHDKVLYADADMNRADWMTGTAAGAGVIGIGLGFWWADAAAAGLISLSVLKDGWSNTKAVVQDLMDRTPEKVDRSGPDEVPDQVRDAVKRLPWVRDAEVRMREAGHVYCGDVYVVPVDDAEPLRRAEEAAEVAQSVSWRVHDVAVELVKDLDEV